MDIFKLIQPELLTQEELVQILQQRGVGTTLLSQSKDKLVTLFRRIALPLPQRELRDNYRGSLLKKLRKKAERLQISESSSNVISYTIGVSGNPTASVTNLEEKRVGERLKPPPDLVNYDRKKIRLNSCSSTTEPSKPNCTSGLDKVIIKKRKNPESRNDADKNGIKISSECVDEANESQTNKLKINKHRDLSANEVETGTNKKEDCNGLKSNSVAKKVSLKRNHLFSKVSTDTLRPEDSTDTASSEPDKKRKPITWP